MTAYTFGQVRSLLPATLVKDRSVLDLGDGRGARHSRCVGAARCVAVEVQAGFCQRAKFLARAEEVCGGRLPRMLRS